MTEFYKNQKEKQCEYLKNNIETISPMVEQLIKSDDIPIFHNYTHIAINFLTNKIVAIFPHDESYLAARRKVKGFKYRRDIYIIPLRHIRECKKNLKKTINHATIGTLNVNMRRT